MESMAIPSEERARGMLAESLANLKTHRRLYLMLNAGYYGLIVLFMLLAAAQPAMRESLWSATKQEVNNGFLAPLAQAYKGGNVPLAIAGTFLVNLLLGSVLYIGATSAIIPFSGVLLTAWRAVLWGVMFCPLDHPLGAGIWLHLVTLVLEGQGYVIAALAAYLHGRAFLSPRSVGAASPGAGYVWGLRTSGRLYVLVACVLLVAAVYEAILGIWILPHIVPAPA